MTRPRRDPTGGQADALQRLDQVLDPISLAVAISKLPLNHALVAAARTGAEVADARWERRERLRQAGKDIAAGLDRSWSRRVDEHVPHAELERRRSEIPHQRLPDPDPDLAAAFAVAEAACRAAQVRATRNGAGRADTDTNAACDADSEADPPGPGTIRGGRRGRARWVTGRQP